VASVGFAPTSTPDPSATTQSQTDDQQTTPEPTTTPTDTNSTTPTSESASKIEVTLPNLEEKTDEVPEPVVVQPELTDDSKDAQIGENLNDIMKKELEGEESESANPVVESPPANEVVSPDVATTTQEQPAESTPNAEQPEEDSNHKKIVIQPINDLSKPKLDAEAAKEEPGVGSVANSTVQPTVVTPNTTENTTTSAPSQPAQPTEHDIISL
jgi:hypothetical protein